MAQMNQQDITVVKRDGRVEELDLDKLHVMVEEACEGLAGVSASQVEMTSALSFYDGISTEDILALVSPPDKLPSPTLREYVPLQRKG